MLSGDLKTMSLADVLQWADANSVSGTLVIERPTGEVCIRIDQRSLVGTTKPDARAVPLSQLHPELPGFDASDIPDSSIALSFFYDQFLDSEATFRFEGPDALETPEIVEVSIWLPEAVMEGLRHMDEWPKINAMYRNDTAHLHRAYAPSVNDLDPAQLAILRCADAEISLSDARLSLGLSRPAFLRGVDGLRRLGLIVVDGAPEGGDLTEKLINQATQLLRAQQFSEAAHVFSALLSADPGSDRIKRLLREAERDQVAYLYERLPAEAAVHRTPRIDVIKNLSRADRLVIEHINDRWDVSTVVLASPLREVETLKTLDKLLKMEALTLILPAA